MRLNFSRNKEEILKEILQDSMKPTSSGPKATKRPKAGKQVPALPSSEDKILKQSNIKESSSQAGAINNTGAGINNNEVRIKPRRKAPPPPRPPPPARHKTPATDATPPVKNTSDIKEVKSSSTHKNEDEKAANKTEASPSGLQKGEKKAKKPKYSKHLNLFGGSSDEECSLSSPVATSSKNAIEQECQEGTIKTSDRQGNGEQNAPERQKKLAGPRKPKKYPKALNPFGGSPSEEESSLSSEGTSTSKGTPEQVCEGGKTKVSEQGDGKEKTSCNECHTSPGRRKKRRSLKKTSKSLPESNPSGSSSEEESVTSQGATPLPISNVPEQRDSGEKTCCTEVPSPTGRRKNRKPKKSKKYPKELNPFGGSIDEEAGALSSKEPERKEVSMTKGTDESGGKQGSSNKDGVSEEGIGKSVPTLAAGASGCDERHLLSSEAVLPPCDGSFLCQTTMEDTSHCGAADVVTTLNNEASGCDEQPSFSKAVFPPCKDKQELEESPVSNVSCQTKMEDTSHCSVTDAISTLNDGASGGDEQPSSSKAVFPPCKDTPELEESPAVSVPCQTKIEDSAHCGAADAVSTRDGRASGCDERGMMEDAFQCGATESAGTTSDQRDAVQNGTDENSLETAPAVCLTKTQETESGATEKEKRKLHRLPPNSESQSSCCANRCAFSNI